MVKKLYHPYLSYIILTSRNWGWRCSSGVEYLPSTDRALRLVPSTTKKNVFVCVSYHFSLQESYVFYCVRVVLDKYGEHLPNQMIMYSDVTVVPINGYSSLW
jgi:hypothetical protein